MVDEIKCIIDNCLNDPNIFNVVKSKGSIKKDKDIYFDKINNTSFSFSMIKSVFCDFLTYRFRLHFKRYSYQTNFEIIEEKDINTFLIKLEKIKDIIIDSNKTLVLVTGDKHQINKERRCANQKKCLIHYTDFKSLEGIILKNGMYAKSLSKYNSEKGFSISKESGKQAFLISFYGNRNVNYKMKTIFKNQSVNKIKIKLELNDNAENLFSQEFPIQCYNKDENLFNLQSFKTLNKNINNETVPGVYLCEMIRPVKYIENTINNVNKEINAEDYIIVDNIARSVLSKYNFQNEIRYIFFLRSYKEITLSYFDKIFLPFNFDIIEKFIITYSSQLSDEKVNRLKKLCENNQKIFLKRSKNEY